MATKPTDREMLRAAEAAAAQALYIERLFLNRNYSAEFINNEIHKLAVRVQTLGVLNEQR
jgi:hypothetical protein